MTCYTTHYVCCAVDTHIVYYMHILDDMLTACDDEDPEAAIATASLLGEKDDSMINLVLIKNNEATVGH